MSLKNCHISEELSLSQGTTLSCHLRWFHWNSQAAPLSSPYQEDEDVCARHAASLKHKGCATRTLPPGAPSKHLKVFTAARPAHAQSSPTLCNPPRLLYPRGFPCKKTGAGCHFRLQRIFPAQGWNPHCRQILYHWAMGEAHLLWSTFLIEHSRTVWRNER